MGIYQFCKEKLEQTLFSNIMADFTIISNYMIPYLLEYHYSQLCHVSR